MADIVRDPIFYRWHSYMEDLVQQFRDKKLPSYTNRDFLLSDDVREVTTQLNLELFSTFSVSSVTTLLSDINPAGTENILLTHMEDHQINLDSHTKIIYQRINHTPYKYRIKINNPRGSRRKVIVRLWLGLATDKQDVR